MVQSNKKRKDKKKLSASHNKSWIWGRHAVVELLEAGKWPVHELYLSDSLASDALDYARDLAESLDVRIKIESADRLRELGRNSEHQGYLAKMKPYPYARLGIIEPILKRKSRRAVIAVLDQIQDPHNFGAIVRSAEVLGVDAIVIGDRDQAEVTPTVARASAGAVNHIPVVQVEDLAKAVADMKPKGAWIIGATEKGGALGEGKLISGEGVPPIVIVVGNEGMGICDDLLGVCDEELQIPQQGRIQSLNVAAAAAILFYEATRV